MDLRLGYEGWKPRKSLISRMAKSIEKNRKHSYATMDPNNQNKDLHSGIPDIPSDLGFGSDRSKTRRSSTTRLNRIKRSVQFLSKPKFFGLVLYQIFGSGSNVHA
ncbi:hypothetical protein YC2023_030578 [Brassica napus]